MVALPGICATHRMLPSRCLLAGHLVVDSESTICVCGADVRRGTLDGLVVTVKSIPFDMTTSSGGSHEVTSRVRLALSYIFTSSPECVQRDHHLEELEPPEHSTSLWRRHIHFAALHHLGID